MTRIAYLNGRFAPISTPAVAVEDRGLQFAHGVYEVLKAIGGRLVDLDRHLDRLERSLAHARIPMPTSRAVLALLLEECVRRNRLAEALVYLQIDRGVAARNHVCPEEVRPTLFVTVRPARFPTPEERTRGVAVITLPDERWARCDIKSVSLLPNVLARSRAAEAGAREAWLVGADGVITEGSASNAWIVDAAGVLRTHPLGPRILGGVTREVVLELARARALPLEERAFTRAEALAAREAFLTSTTSLVLPVTRIDDRPVGDGLPGPVTRTLARAYAEHAGLAIATEE
ncbi:MAG: D-amino-acid transaminase [Geminicoccaceae bacterium]|nr:D-amino-acid transaminase [Geminicoccaceae bacterium]MCS7268210.1 D-amino-acid transaminase [Geminicoccaceae bacterium]MCX7631181.1 D-amino-acid transaminase [Geminicoccaceae bacterium]MDW8125020.1 D-amino-acid transaminase [Geminicoccaceae bacterium]MDW8341231.1 D-amino-acid transaminase [Geminicoccaceae bacterium]